MKMAVRNLKVLMVHRSTCWSQAWHCGTVIWPNNDTVFPMTKNYYLSLWNEALASPLSPCGEHGVPPIPRGDTPYSDRPEAKMDLSENRVPQILWLTLVVYSNHQLPCWKGKVPVFTQINFRQVQIGLKIRHRNNLIQFDGERLLSSLVTTR